MTLGQAIEKVGVGGKVINDEYGDYIVSCVGTDNALLLNDNGYEQAWLLQGDGWSPVLPKKRVVLQAWEFTNGTIAWLREGHDQKDYGGTWAIDIPNMIFEEGKQVFE